MRGTVVVLGLAGLLAIPSPNAPTVNCATCNSCYPAQEHKAPLTAGGPVANPHSFCLGPTQGCDGHPACLSGPMAAGATQTLHCALVARAASGDSVAILRLILAEDGLAFVNIERSALQVVSACDRETVLLHLPLPQQRVAALSVVAGGQRAN
jgi:hypothetical protein